MMVSRWLVLLCAGLALAASVPAAAASTRRALLIGINSYVIDRTRDAQTQGRRFNNLHGAVPDAEAMRDLLQARYGFKSVELITDAKATRARILEAAQRHLVDEPRPGDVALFYYAGHGSQLRNSQSAEADKLDETIVPADAAAGAKDIRDKELLPIFMRALHKGVILTAIFDSCHSGSIARGQVARLLPPQPGDAADPTELPRPEDHGALILSAAQDFQLSVEDEDPREGWHGMFTLALLRALREAGPNEAAGRLFLRVKAAMQATAPAQEPALSGNTQRKSQSLFGDVSGAEVRTVVAAGKALANGGFELQGGLAIGLSEGTELGGPSGARLRVTRAISLSRSEAVVLSGQVRPGDFFAVERYGVPAGADLRVVVARDAPSASELARLMPALGGLRTAKGVHWVVDSTEEEPTHVVAWQNGEWLLSPREGPSQSLGKAPTAKAVLAALPAAGARLFVQVPPPRELTAQLKWEGTAIAEAPRGDYVLVGRVTAQGPDYAWVRVGATSNQALAQRTSLPVRTGWLRGEPAEVAAQLKKRALALARVRSWLLLPKPADDGSFPFGLALRDRSGKLITEGPLRQGESYWLVLVPPHHTGGTPAPRYVYVFSIDKDGTSRLLFPPATAGNVENRVPYRGWTAGTLIELGNRPAVQIGPPFGMDTYVLLSSKTPLANPDILEFDGVARVADPQNPLERLLNTIQAGTGTRAGLPPSPPEWSIERLPMQSVAN